MDVERKKPTNTAAASVVAAVLAQTIFALLCLLWFVAPALGDEPDEVEATRLREIFADFGAPGLPGVSVMVVQDGVRRHQFHQGLADVGANLPVSDDSVFNVGSVSKQFTVFGMLLLRDDGKLSLHDDIRRYLPELPEYEHVVTLEHLARHTSGLNSQQYAALMGSWTQTDQRTHRQMLDLIRRQSEPNFLPGSRFEYSNAGTVLLAEVITRVAGMPFPTFMKRRVYEPLGMSHTFNRGEAALIISNEAHSYYFEDGILKKALNPSGVQGYTNVYSTTADLAKWLANFSSHKVGSEQTHRDLLSVTVLPDGAKTEHRMGLYATPYRGFRQFQHTGSDRGYTSYVGWFPDHDLAIVILCNVEGIDIFASAYATADVFLPMQNGGGAEVPPLTLQEKFIELDGPELQRFTGRYWSDQIGDVRSIEVVDGVLQYVRSASNMSPLRPVGPSRFRMMDVSDVVQVAFDESGMTFEEAAGSIRLNRLAQAPVEPSELMETAGLYVSDEVSAVYRLSLCNGVPTLSNAVQDALTLTRIRKDVFRSNGWFLRSICFHRDAQDRVTGFMASNVGVRGIQFTKVTTQALPPPAYDACQQVKLPARG